MGHALRWGLLSTARINRRTIAAAAQTDDAEIVAVASRERQRAESYARAHSIPTAHGSYEDLLADDGVDAVYISLPNGLHHLWTMHAIAAGKHVLVEKPYSREPNEVVEAFAAAEAADLVVAEAFMWQHNPQTARLLELLPDIGTLVTIRTTFSFRLDDLADIRLAPALAGGSLMDVGGYCVHAARLLAGGEPERVFGIEARGPSGVDTRFSGLLSFAGGVIAEFTCGFETIHEGLEAIGTHGSLFLPDPWHVRQPVIYLDGRAIQTDRVSSYRCQLERFAAEVRGPRSDRRRNDALGQARTIEALYRSAGEGMTIAL